MFKIEFCIWHSNQSKTLILNQNASNLYFQCVIFYVFAWHFLITSTFGCIKYMYLHLYLIHPNFVGSLRYFGKDRRKKNISNFHQEVQVLNGLYFTTYEIDDADLSKEGLHISNLIYPSWKFYAWNSHWIFSHLCEYFNLNVGHISSRIAIFFCLWILRIE